MAAGMDGHVAKPIEMAKLYDAIETAVAARARRLEGGGGRPRYRRGEARPTASQVRRRHAARACPAVHLAEHNKRLRTVSGCGVVSCVQRRPRRASENISRGTVPMKKILLPIAAVSAARRRRSRRRLGPGLRPRPWPWQVIRTSAATVASLDQRIDMGIRNRRPDPQRSLAPEAATCAKTARLESRYRRGGLSGWERADPGSSLRPHQRP